MTRKTREFIGAIITLVGIVGAFSILILNYGNAIVTLFHVLHYSHSPYFINAILSVGIFWLLMHASLLIPVVIASIGLAIWD